MFRGTVFWARYAMTLGSTKKHVATCLRRMNTHYGGVVFNEWAIVEIKRRKARILAYQGPRQVAFQSYFVEDAQSLLPALLEEKHEVGDFDFNRFASGTQFDCFLVLGPQFFLLCNNTQKSMLSITQHPRWKEAQIPFVELSEAMRAEPMRISD